MDNITLKFTCEKCKTTQEQVKKWTRAPAKGPLTNDRTKAGVICEKCGHQQVVKVPQ